METNKVYAAIEQVMTLLGKDGIQKDRKNVQQGYSFRGIDDVYNALHAHLAAAHLVILPRFSEREVIERQSQKGGALFYVTLKGDFDLVCTEDGSKHTVGPFYGEAMDSGDKATNKAMSAAYKYMAMEVFCIPTNADNDADATTHEVKAAAAPEIVSPSKVADLKASLDEAKDKDDLRIRTASALQACGTDKDAKAEVKGYAIGLSTMYDKQVSHAAN